MQGLGGVIHDRAVSPSAVMLATRMMGLWDTSSSTRTCTGRTTSLASTLRSSHGLDRALELAERSTPLPQTPVRRCRVKAFEKFKADQKEKKAEAKRQKEACLGCYTSWRAAARRMLRCPFSRVVASGSFGRCTTWKQPRAAAAKAAEEKDAAAAKEALDEAGALGKPEQAWKFGPDLSGGCRTGAC